MQRASFAHPPCPPTLLRWRRPTAAPWRRRRRLRCPLATVASCQRCVRQGAGCWDLPLRLGRDVAVFLVVGAANCASLPISSPIHALPLTRLPSPHSAQFVAGTKTGGSGPPGFPSLTTIKSTAELRKIGVNVFGMASRKESLILQLKVGAGREGKGGCVQMLVSARTRDGCAKVRQAHSLVPPTTHRPACLVRMPQGLASQLGGQRLTAEQVAGALLGQRCWVKWPYLQEAVVEAVSDAGEGVMAGSGGNAEATCCLSAALLHIVLLQRYASESTAGAQVAAGEDPLQFSHPSPPCPMRRHQGFPERWHGAARPRRGGRVAAGAAPHAAGIPAQAGEVWGRASG